MRIVAGSLRGRHFDSPKNSKTHPMSEKMRGALFNMLGDIYGLAIYDAFGGSGGIAIEAISRGAKNAVITEVDKYAWSVIKKNINDLKLDNQIKVTRANAAEWSKNNSAVEFDLVICDPPYDKIEINQLNKLTDNVKNSGVLVLSLPGKFTVPAFDSFELLKSKNYGDSSLTFYRKLDDEK